MARYLVVVIGVIIIICGVMAVLTFRSKDGHFYSNGQEIGVGFYKGPYRSWAVRFADGECLIGTNWVSFHYDKKGYFQLGPYKFPKFEYVNTARFADRRGD